MSTDGTPLSFPTSLGTSTADEIRLLGQDLTADLMGKVGFGELAFWLVAMRRPTPSETRVFEAVLVALADHGFTPTAIAARLTYLSAPDSLQGALAAGLLGGGSRFLGVTEDCGTYLHDVLKTCGGENVCGGSTRYPVVGLEEVEDLKPEVVLLPDEPYPFSAEDLPEFYALDIPASREDRIHLLDGKLLTWYGPRMASSLTQLSALLRF